MSPAREAHAAADEATAFAFAQSWNHVGSGSVYTREQFLEWMAPIEPSLLADKTVLELGYGNGSLLRHMADYRPLRLTGVELGDTLERTRQNLGHLPSGMLELHRGDLTQVDVGRHDLVYCIGVLHHLNDPDAGFAAVLRHTKPGGRFHCWVYAHEGNGVVRHLVEPVRRVACRLPWWLAKYGVALPLAVPYFVYAKALARVANSGPERRRAVSSLPLGAYSLWIARRSFPFFHHVAFDQIVTPRTRYLRRAVIDGWLERPEIDPSSTYVVQRNGNSWKFGGRVRDEASRHGFGTRSRP